MPIQIFNKNFGIATGILFVGIILFFDILFWNLTLTEKFLQISLTEWIQIISSVAAAIAAWASWRAVLQTEEITTKPIIGIQEALYQQKTLYLEIINLSSSSSDRWARNIKAEISGSNLFEKDAHLIGPGRSVSFRFNNIEQPTWLGKILIISFSSSTDKVYKLKYQLPNNFKDEEGIFINKIE